MVAILNLGFLFETMGIFLLLEMIPLPQDIPEQQNHYIRWFSCWNMIDSGGHLGGHLGSHLEFGILKSWDNIYPVGR